MTTQTQIDPKVIARIRKLQHLTVERGASESEAQSAAAKAQQLMMEHNISIATIAAHGDDTTGEGGRRSKERNKGRAMYEWQRNLMSTIADTNFCVVRTHEEWKRGRWTPAGYDLIGREANVAAALGMFDYLAQTCENLAFEHVGSDNTQRMSRAAMSFKDGCAERLRDRLQKRHVEMLAEQAKAAREAQAAAGHPGASTGNGLVVVMTDYAEEEAHLNRDLQMGWEPGTSKARDQRQSVISAARSAVWSKLKREALDITGEDELREWLARELEPLLGGLDDVEAALRGAVSVIVSWRQTELKEERETPKQKAAREAKEARANARYWRARDREANEKASRRDWGSYRAGSQAGERVGLDKQVGGKGRDPKKLG